jgi:hypothetical protein
MGYPADEQNARAYQQMQPPQGHEQRSLIPVSFQDNLNLQPVQQEYALPIIQSPSLERMLPALPEDATYVPPMYTKPRPIIPRYRIISGMISMLIVMLLTCSGLGFYAKSSGLLHSLRVWAAGGPPPSLQAVQNNALPNPKNTPDKGPAYDIIPSAATTSRIDAKTKVPLDQVKIFKPGQTFYLTYIIPQPKDKGTVTIKWYTNGNLFITSPPQQVDPKQDNLNQGNLNSAVAIEFAQPAEGKVEIYWNDKMAQTLYFVVRP